MRMLKGSFTIEAIIWIPIMLCLMLCTIKESLLFYEEVVNGKEQKVENWDCVSKFYEMCIWKELGEEKDE